MQRSSTMFLRGAVLAIGAAVLALCIYVLPNIHSGWEAEYPDLANLRYPLLSILSATTIPFYFVLYQTMKLLNYVDKNKAFSELSVKALKKIKYCAAIIGLLYVAAEPIWYYIAQAEDAPGVIIIGMIPIGAAFAVATFAGVLQRLLQNAIDIKSENDLTV
jgi:hypothetical protein